MKTIIEKAKEHAISMCPYNVNCASASDCINCQWGNNNFVCNSIERALSSFLAGAQSAHEEDMFGEINYCHECKFFVGVYCNGEKRNPKDYACLKFIKKKIMKQLFMCKFFSMHKLKDYDNYTISDIQGREIEKVIVKECEFCGELKIKRFSLLPIKDRSY